MLGGWGGGHAWRLGRGGMLGGWGGGTCLAVGEGGHACRLGRGVTLLLMACEALRFGPQAESLECGIGSVVELPTVTKHLCVDAEAHMPCVVQA